MNTSSFLSSSLSDRQDEEGLEEASMRNALERIGPSSGGRSSARTTPDTTKRRRFVRDGEVPVEKHLLGRATAPRTAASPRLGGSARAVHFSEDDNSELSRVRRNLAEEKLRAEEAERQLNELQATQRGLVTRLGVAETVVRDAQAKLAEREAALAQVGRDLRVLQQTLAEREAEIATLSQQVEKARAATRKAAQTVPDAAQDAAPNAPQAEAAPARPKARRRRTYVLAQDEAESEGPSPVKWWKD
ncbi:hypothetical protein K2X14_00965 [Acetobacter sp. TBRC 12305]|uniref:Uncharacterized protein n=1 Tax=Acetobacter garciniae TaxID=2817435 RepID=A0A939KKZ1_9PROT|nr:hypothetical protein [Acetobacter garciniae]MBO1323723.1 hypothetical protein [Acetobacter garciniae]MBX0343412.1 hypothetical protein [Acetobacter garciniae]